MSLLPGCFTVFVGAFQINPSAQVLAPVAAPELLYELIIAIDQFARPHAGQSKPLILAERFIRDGFVEPDLQQNAVARTRMVGNGMDPIAIAFGRVARRLRPQDQNRLRIIGVLIVFRRWGCMLSFFVMADLEFQRAQAPCDQVRFLTVGERADQINVIPSHIPSPIDSCVVLLPYALTSGFQVKERKPSGVRVKMR